jgi:thiamine biosynthesis lipoprotein ApbE
MAIYIQRSFLRINLLLCLSLAACGAEPRPAVSRVWPEMGAMLSVAAWGSDSAGVVRALSAAHDSVDRIDSLVQRHRRIAALDSVQREVRRRTGVLVPVDSIAPGYALDRAALALPPAADSALLDIGGQYLWIGPRPTYRTVGIADPDNSLRSLAAVDITGGSIRTRAPAAEARSATRSVTVLARDGTTAAALALAFMSLSCDSVFALANGVSVVCADLVAIRWSPELEKRVRVPVARVP